MCNLTLLQQNPKEIANHMISLQFSHNNMGNSIVGMNIGGYLFHLARTETETRIV